MLVIPADEIFAPGTKNGKRIAEYIWRGLWQIANVSALKINIDMG